MDEQRNELVQINNIDGTNQYEHEQLHGTSAQASVLASTTTLQSSKDQATGPQLGSPHQLAYHQIHHHQQQLLRQQLQALWTTQYQENEKATDFKNHSLPLARIKKIMKADEDVRMISAEAPIVFARACEMFILELTLRSWSHTEENKRRTLQKNDIAAAITRTDIFDFLVDIVPKEDVKDEGIASPSRGPMPVGPLSSDSIAYCYMPSLETANSGPPGLIMNKPGMDPILYAQQAYSYLPPQMWPQGSQQSKTSSDS